MPDPIIPNLYSLYIYANEECNLACKHCWITAKLSTSVRQRSLGLADYCRFIDEAIPLGLSYVKISGGEPLLSKAEVLGIIAHTHARKIAARIETNGTLIDDEVAIAIRATNAFVSISLDGSTAELHEALRVVPGSFDGAIRGLELLRKHRVPVEVIMSVHRKNAHDVGNVVCLAGALSVGRVKLNPVISSGRGAKMDQRGECLSAAELQKLVTKIEAECSHDGVPVTVSAEPAFHSLDSILRGQAVGGKCGFKNLLGILANGSISFCGMGYKTSQYVLGKMAGLNLAEMWSNHPTLQAIRRDIPARLEGICGNCMLKTTCQGACRSSAFDRYGSITAPSPGCQDLYEAGLFRKTRMLDPSRDCSFSPVAASASAVVS